MNHYFLILICIFVFFTQGHTQLAEGPAHGAVSGYEIVSTDSFPNVTSTVYADDHSEMILRSKVRNPLFRTDRLAKENYLQPPLEGSNYMEDPSVKANNKSVLHGVDAGSNYPISFQGILDNNKRTPPDPYIAVGTDHVMTVVNARFRISEKSGSTLTTIDAKSWFLSIYPELIFIYDPKIIYDHFANRWIMVWLGDTDFATKVSYYLVSVSDDDDPTGTWYNWKIPADVNGDQKVDNWCDYQGVGFDEKAFYFVSDQLKYPDQNFDYAYTKIRILEKELFYSIDSDSVSWNDFWNIKDLEGNQIKFGARPTINFSISDEYYIAAKPDIDPADYFLIYKIINPLSDPELSAVQTPVTPWYLPSNAKQLGEETPLRSSQSLCNELVYRDSSLWMVHTVASGSDKQFSSIRYLRFDLNTNTALEDVAFGAENYWYFFPAISVDQNKNVAITFCRSGYYEYAGAYFTWRLYSDPPGLRASATIKAGKAPYNWFYLNGNRYGDYSGITLDPVDPNLFWMYTEYTESPANNWGTWIYATPLQSLPEIVETYVSHGEYVQPGTDTIIVNAKVSDPANLLLNAEFVPFDSVQIIEIELFDDGLHNDGAANDSTFGNLWLASSEEQHYSIDIKAERLASDTISIREANIVNFTTKGPLQIVSFDTTGYTSRFRSQRFNLVIQNLGLAATVENISINISTDDPRVSQISVPVVDFQDLSSGAIDTALTSYVFNFSSGYHPDSTIGNPIKFNAAIYSGDYMFWTDSFMFDILEIGTSVKTNEFIPGKFALYQNYPNPFNPTTTIAYQLPKTSRVDLSIYSLLGQRVAALVSKKQPAGSYQVVWDGSGFSSGVYIYKISTDQGNEKSKKLILLK